MTVRPKVILVYSLLSRLQLKMSARRVLCCLNSEESFTLKTFLRSWFKRRLKDSSSFRCVCVHACLYTYLYCLGKVKHMTQNACQLEWMEMNAGSCKVIVWYCSIWLSVKELYRQIYLQYRPTLKHSSLLLVCLRWKRGSWTMISTAPRRLQCCWRLMQCRPNTLTTTKIFTLLDTCPVRNCSHRGVYTQIF